LRIALASSGIMVALTAVGAVNQWPVMPFALPFIAILVSCLVAAGRIRPRHYFVYIFGLSLSMLWANSMLGTYVVGTDIQRELRLSSMALDSGWHPAAYAQVQSEMSNTSIVVGVIAPLLSRMTGLDIVWVYKAILPVLLAIVPVILYFAFARQIGRKRAFYAILFFLAVPVFSMEIVSIGKSMVAEFFFAIAIFVLTASVRLRWKVPAVAVFLALALMSHYSVGIMALCYMVAVVALAPLLRRLRFAGGLRLSRGAFASACVALPLLVLGGYLYFMSVGGESVIDAVVRIGSWSTKMPDVVQAATTPPLPLPSQAETVPQGDGWLVRYMESQPALVKLAVGFDFAESSVPGKVFRVFQYLTELLVVLGFVAISLRRVRYRLRCEFAACMWAAVGVVLACIVLPGFSTILNATRFYHLSLFFIAPLIVPGAEMLWRRGWQWLLVGVLGVYMLFTSGVVFEVMGMGYTDKVEVPYSHSLSGDKTGLVGIYSEDDVECARWLAEMGDDLPIVAGYNGVTLLSSVIPPVPRLKPCTVCAPYYFGSEVDGKHYVFLTGWNAERRMVVMPLEVGLRTLKPLPPVNGSKVYAKGKAAVYLEGE